MTYCLVFIPQFLLWKPFSQSVISLLLAAFLGGLIGLERELKHRPAGLRTHMFICIGSAMFTILSAELANVFGIGDHTRIAAQIIPGIGFIGAGSILHSRGGGVSGLTTAATIFVVASIGMACGGGLYLFAAFASALAFLSLRTLGWLEDRFSLKASVMNYIVESDRPAAELVGETHIIIDQQGRELRGLHLSRGEGKQRLSFSVDATRHQQAKLMEALRHSEVLKNFEVRAGLDIE